MSDRYLVTGGSGFIGSWLVRRLLHRGDSVIALDNLSTGRFLNIAEVADHPRFRFVHGSVLDELTVDELASEVDVIVHLAAAVGVKLIVNHPLKSLTTNIRGSEIVIDAAHRYRRKILFTSTSEIYGKNTSVLREDSDRILGSPGVVRWAYSTAKAVDEILANAYHRERALPTIITRLFNTVGPRQSAAYGMVLPTLVQQALRGQPLTVFGNGLQTRCFCHVKDVVAGIVALLDDERAIGNTFNIGGSEEISILGLARKIISMTGSSSDIRFVPYDEAYEVGFEDMERRVPDTGKILTLNGWAPASDLDAIVSETIEYVRQQEDGDISVNSMWGRRAEDMLRRVAPARPPRRLGVTRRLKQQ